MGATITYVVEQRTACYWYRCRVPSRGLCRAGQDAEVPEEPTRARLEASDVIVLERPSMEVSLAAIRRANQLGKTTVVDMDDDYWNIHPTNPVHAFWKESGAIHVLEECLREADVATVTTPELAELVRRYNTNVFVLPNMLSAEDWEPNPAGTGPMPGTDLVVGWAGSHTHLMDLMPLAGVVEDLLTRYPRLEVRIAGMFELPFKPHERLTVAEPVPIEQYPSLIGGFDIGLAPVVDDRFNRCKSDLKFIEYGMLGIPSVASRAATYSRSVRHGKNGFLAHNPKDWLTYISRLIEDEDLRRTIGEEARRFARTRLIDGNVGLWLDAYAIRGR